MTEIFDLTFKHPSRWIIYGPSQSGKTTFVENLMKNHEDYFGIKFEDKILCCDYIPQNGFKDFELCTNIEELITSRLTPDKPSVVVLDDQMNSAINDESVSDFYSKHSHHLKSTVIFITQNLFPKSKYMRNIYLNSSYIVIMKNPAEILQIQSLSNRISGKGERDKLIKAYNDATKFPFSYILIDLNQETPRKFRFRSDIFNKNFSQIVYI